MKGSYNFAELFSSDTLTTLSDQYCERCHRPRHFHILPYKSDNGKRLTISQNSCPQRYPAKPSHTDPARPAYLPPGGQYDTHT